MRVRVGYCVGAESQLSLSLSLSVYIYIYNTQAAVGLPLSELYNREVAESMGLSATLMLQGDDRVNLDSVSPTFWGFCLGLMAAIDMYGTAKAAEGHPTYFPGNLHFDPAGLYPADPAGQKRMQAAEIKHGRVAMLAIVGFLSQEYVTEVGIIDETPLFFHNPLTTTTADFL